jgi:hypothetical protein
MVYREEWADKILNGRSILECALDVHMTFTGSMERSPADQEDDVRVLFYALKNWQEGHAFAKRFDDAVKELISAALVDAGHTHLVCKDNP